MKIPSTDTKDLLAAENMHHHKESDELQGELEQVIAQLWKETFHLEKVNSDDNFFALGGNSLIGIELMDRVSARLEIPLPVVMLFQNPTPRQMAQYLNILECSTDLDLSSL